MTTIRPRKPLNELLQPIDRPRVRRTYGKKDRSAGRAQTDRDIFLADDDLENAFINLNLTESNFPSKQLVIEENDLEKVSGLRYDKKTLVDIKETGVPGEGEVIEADAVNFAYVREDTCSTNPDHFLSSENLKELNEIVELSDHKSVQSFDEHTRKVSEVYDIEKIGEGSYSSVFLLTKRKPEERPDLPDDRTIIKMIPLHLSSEPAHDDTTRVSYVANEIRTLKTMDQVHGFLRYRGVVLVQGNWPASFLDAFRAYKRRYSKRAENMDPEEIFSGRQCYALIEMQDAGHEFDTYIKRPSTFQIYDIFWMATIFLAMAEELVEFEHRDLHSSNICIKASGSQSRTDVTKDFVAKMESEPERKLGLTGMSITIIDYTLSRARLDAFGANQAFRVLDGDSSENREDMSNNERYEDRMQHATYTKTSRCIALASDDSKSSNESLWSHFVPKTNVCWLAYLLAVLFNRSGKQQKTKYVQGSNKLAKKLQDDMINALKEVECVILDSDLEALPGSASELLAMAVSNSWLSKDEIEKFKQRLEEEQG